jgi:hypothetical protein
MTTQKFTWKTLVPALLIGAASASTVHAAAPETSQCVFEEFAPVAVQPYTEAEYQAYGSYSFVRGAQLFVPAQAGLTKEWLAASAQHALTSTASSAKAAQADGLACSSPNVQNVTVHVTSAGNGFWVQLIARDEVTAHELLAWGKSLVKGHEHGTAARVSAAPATPATPTAAAH